MTRRIPKRRGRRRGERPSGIRVEHVFDQFTVADLYQKPRFKDEVLRFVWDHYAALQHQRSAASEEITASLIKAAVGPFPFSRWMRVVDYKFANDPLSAVGSIGSMTGGRFNIGDIDPIKFRPFPALYLASDQETALAEKFGQREDKDGLTAAQLALRSDRSYTCVALDGRLDTVVDLSKMDRLTAFVDIIGRFTLSADLRERAKRILRRPKSTITTIDELGGELLAAHWRAEPAQLSVPHSCQVFGQLVAHAGIEGILFPSTKSLAGAQALAIYPQNLQGDSFVQLADPAPSATKHVRLDSKTWKDFGC